MNRSVMMKLMFMVAACVIVLMSMGLAVWAFGPEPWLNSGFETGTEPNKMGWGTTATGGYLIPSTEMAHTGSKSLKATQNDTNWFQYNCKNLNNPMPGQAVSGYMYDNMATAASDGRYGFKLQCDTNATTAFAVNMFAAIGPINGTTYTNYVVAYKKYNVNEVLIDTGIPRTVGWHKFTFDYMGTNTMRLYIDGTKVLDSTDASGAGYTFNQDHNGVTNSYKVNYIFFGNIKWAGYCKTGFFFDDIQVFKPGAYVSGPDVVVADATGSKTVAYVDESCNGDRQPLNTASSVWSTPTITPADANVSWNPVTHELTVDSALTQKVDVRFNLTNGTTYNKAVTIYPSRNNMVFSEDFEKPTNDVGIPTGWVKVGALTPVIAHGSAKSGAYYYKPTGHASDNDYVTYSLSEPTGIQGRYDVWFFDDPNKYAMSKAILWDHINTSSVSCGVFKYTDSTGIENGARQYFVTPAYGQYRVTDVPRTYGWHKITFDASSALYLKIYMDDRLVYDTYADYAGFNPLQSNWKFTMKKIGLGNTDATNGANMDGFKFDDLRVYFDPNQVEYKLDVPVLSGAAISGATVGTGLVQANTFYDNTGSSEDTDICLILAVYDGNGRLVDCKTDKKIVTQGTKSTFNCSTDILNAPTNGVVKAFIWNDIDNMKPKSIPAQFPYIP